MNDSYWIAWIVLAFGCGSLPFGMIIARAKGVDLRAVGSGNTGATNVGRALGRGWGIACFLLDAGKGATPVLVSGALMGVLGMEAGAAGPSAEWGWMAVGIAAILGHVYSPFLNFKGGKGVATACGALLALYPVMTYPVLIGGGLFAICVLATGYMSLASMVAAASVPVSVGLIGILEGVPDGGAAGGVVPGLCAGLLIAFTVVWRHRGNLRRIRSGSEPRVLGRGRMRTPSQPAGGVEPSKQDTTSTNRP